MVKYINNNRSYEYLKPQGIVLHETATPGATAEAEYNYFNSAYRDASAHGFVDWNGYIQTIPYNEVAWHAGYTANHRYIGIEMCRPAKHNPEQFQKIWENTISVFTYIITKFSLSVNDITTHHEVSLKWRETNHTDPTALLAEYGKTIDDFKNAVKEKLREQEGLTMTQYEELKSIITKQEEKVKALEAKLGKIDTYIYNYIDDNMPNWAKPTIKKLVDKGVLVGTEEGLNLNTLMMRILVILDRIGIFDK